MSDLIQAKKKKTINISVKGDISAPELPVLTEKTFTDKSVEILRSALEEKGVIVPEHILRDISQAYHEIGKEYWLSLNKFKT